MFPSRGPSSGRCSEAARAAESAASGSGCSASEPSDEFSFLAARRAASWRRAREGGMLSGGGIDGTSVFAVVADREVCSGDAVSGGGFCGRERC